MERRENGLIEFRTSAGYYIVVDEETLVCGVYRGRIDTLTKEQVNQSGIQVPVIVFLGGHVRPIYESDGLTVLPVESERISVRYWVGAEASQRKGKEKSLQLKPKVQTDQFPVFIYWHPEASDFIEQLNNRNKSRYKIVVIAADVSSVESVGIRAALPLARIFQTNDHEDSSEKIPEKVRAEDVIQRSEIGPVAQNPVYMARVLLRRLDFVGVAQLAVDLEIVPRDVEFILAFLETMYKNETRNPELEKYKKPIGDLRHFFQIIQLIFSRNQAGIDQELETGVSSTVANYLMPFIEKLQKKEIKSEDEIALWEIQYRLKHQKSG